MSIFRLLVAWLVLAALPLQGMAAASMLLCGQGRAAAAAAHETHEAHGDHGHDHGHPPAASASHDDGATDHHAAAADSGDADHPCPVCGGLCHGVVLPESVPVLAAADLPSAGLPQPHVPALTRASPRPDKPPRA